MSNDWWNKKKSIQVSSSSHPQDIIKKNIPSGSNWWKKKENNTKVLENPGDKSPSFLSSISISTIIIIFIVLIILSIIVIIILWFTGVIGDKKDRTCPHGYKKNPINFLPLCDKFSIYKDFDMNNTCINSKCIPKDKDNKRK